MKKLKLAKIMANTLVIASVFVLNPVGASAEWRQDSNGWWNTEGSSWSIGWRQIDGKWYYFGQDGYMAHDTIIDGYKLGSDGAWIVTANPTTTTATSSGTTSTDKDTVVPQLANPKLSGKNTSKDPNKFTLNWTKATDNKTPQNKLRYYLYKSESISYQNDITAWESNATLVNKDGSLDIDSMEFTVNNKVENYFKLIVLDEANNKTAYETMKRNIFNGSK